MKPGLEGYVFKIAMVEVVFMLGVVIRKYAQKSKLETVAQTGHIGGDDDDQTAGG